MSQQRRRGPRGDLTRARILEAADQVLRSKGIAGLSLRAVAQEAGVAPNAIYTYVPTMAELRNALGDGFLTRLDLGLLQGDDPRTALGEFLRHLLRTFGDSPRHVELLAGQPVIGPGSLALHEALLTFFADSLGWDTSRSARATLFLTEWVHGHLLLAASDPAGPDSAEAGRTPLTDDELSAYPRSAVALSTPLTDSPIDLPLRAIFGAGPPSD
ncbi:TetR/AcrR family transcriptional regulator [Promicromonospora aerolata]|uniref:TetR/AcrR family transcriptional regulator n=1 Tax=Promicromonospora aerolata TaxID=195749 RepID=A0ABW4V6L6_9MICO